MVFFEQPGALRQAVFGGFNEEKGFSAFFDLVLPPVAGADVGDKIDAGCALLFQEKAGQFLGLTGGAGGRQKNEGMVRWDSRCTAYFRSHTR